MAQELQRRYDIKRFYNKSMQGKGVNREMSNTDQTIELKIEDAMNIIIDLCGSSSVGEITGTQFNELAQEQYQVLLRTVNEARLDELENYPLNWADNRKDTAWREMILSRIKQLKENYNE